MYIINKSEPPRVVPEKYNVLWQDYNDHLRDMLHTMRKFDEFTDVTLICDDQREVNAHKVVLSACSPVLKTILQKKNYGIPIVYLKGIKFPEMENILQFMYLGQTTVEQNRITNFLDVAKNLEIKELSDKIEVQKPVEQSNTIQLPNNPVPAGRANLRQYFTTLKPKAPEDVDPILPSPIKTRLPKREERSLTRIIDKVKSRSVEGKVSVKLHHKTAKTGTSSETKIEPDDNPDDPAVVLESELEMLEDHTTLSESSSATREKQEFKSPLNQSNSQTHRIPLNNIPPPERVYQCQKCGFTSTSKDELKDHKLSAHPGQQPSLTKPQVSKNYACFMCQYKSTDKTVLTSHIAKEHTEEIGNLVNA